jgi:predicted RNA-binding protein (virulence factor B family)
MTAIMLSNLVVMVSTMNCHQVAWKRAQVIQATIYRTSEQGIVVMANEDVGFQLVVSIESLWAAVLAVDSCARKRFFS